MPKFVEIAIVVAGFLAISARRNDDRHLICFGLGHDGIAIVAFVGQSMLSVHAFDQGCSLRTIRCGTCCNKDSDRHTMRIHGQMYLTVEPPFVTAMS
jgi:Zn-dependent alcohol dehydrogenase